MPIKGNHSDLDTTLGSESGYWSTNYSGDSEDDASQDSSGTSDRSDFFSVGDEDEIEKAQVDLEAQSDIRVRIMKEYLKDNQCAAYIMSEKYMYVGEEVGWVPFTSMSAARRICDVCGIMAFTKFMDGARPVVIGLQNWTPPVIVLGPTVCQGKIRCHIHKRTVDENGRMTSVTLHPATPLNIPPEDINQRTLYTAKGSFCTSSTRVERLLRTIKTESDVDITKRGYLCQRIFQVFGENTKTILWLIGDMLVDFGTKRLFMLYGPGGIGKSAVVTIIRNCASNLIEDIPGRYMARSSKATRNYGNSLDTDRKASLSNVRLALIGDVELTNDDEHLNMQTVKEITGGDETSHGRVSCTAVMSLNKLFNYEFMSEYTRSDRVRRVVVVPTLTHRQNRDSSQKPASENDKMMLIATCIGIRLKYDGKPPLTTTALIMTLFQTKYSFVFHLVEIDSDSSIVENYVATRLLCHKFNINEGIMQQCLRTVGSDCCKILAGVYVIGNIRTRFKTPIYREKSVAEVKKQKAENKYKSKGNFVVQQETSAESTF